MPGILKDGEYLKHGTKVLVFVINARMRHRKNQSWWGEAPDRLRATFLEILDGCRPLHLTEAPKRAEPLGRRVRESGLNLVATVGNEGPQTQAHSPGLTARRVNRGRRFRSSQGYRRCYSRSRLFGASTHQTRVLPPPNRGFAVEACEPYRTKTWATSHQKQICAP